MPEHFGAEAMQEIKLPCYGIVVTLAGPGGRHITHDELKEDCPHCGDPDCCFGCDRARARLDTEDAQDVASRLQFNGAMDGIMSLVLAHACAGVDIKSPKYVTGVQTAIDACINNLGE